jgi:hypothetical protein
MALIAEAAGERGLDRAYARSQHGFSSVDAQIEQVRVRAKAIGALELAGQAVLAHARRERELVHARAFRERRAQKGFGGAEPRIGFPLVRVFGSLSRLVAERPEEYRVEVRKQGALEGLSAIGGERFPKLQFRIEDKGTVRGSGQGIVEDRYRTGAQEYECVAPVLRISGRAFMRNACLDKDYLPGPRLKDGIADSRLGGAPPQ